MMFNIGEQEILFYQLPITLTIQLAFAVKSQRTKASKGVNAFQGKSTIRYAHGPSRASQKICVAALISQKMGN